MHSLCTLNIAGAAFLILLAGCGDNPGATATGGDKIFIGAIHTIPAPR